MDKKFAFYYKKLSPIMGGTIVGTVLDEKKFMLGLKIETETGEKILWFLRDDEGNGPGSFDIAD